MFTGNIAISNSYGLLSVYSLFGISSFGVTLSVFREHKEPFQCIEYILVLSNLSHHHG